MRTTAERIALASDPTTDAATLRALADDEDDEVRLAVARNETAPLEALIRTLHGCSDTRRLAIGFEVAWNPVFLERCRTAPDEILAIPQREATALIDRDAPDEVLELLACHPSELVRTFLAEHDYGPLCAGLLAGDPSPDVRSALVMCEWLPWAIHVRLARDPEPLVRASSRATAPDELARLACHENPRVRERVADNRSAPPEVLTVLATDGFDCARVSVAMNPSAPIEALRRLARDPKDVVRFEIARHPGLPDDALRAMAENDADEEVRWMALDTLEERRRAEAFGVSV